MTEERSSAILGLAAAGPIAIATLAVLAFISSELLGRTPSSYGPMRNVAEAAASGYASDVLRLLGSGEDPNRIWPVRKEIISPYITRVTALEAAIWSRRSQMVHLFDLQGAIVDEATRHHLVCLASDLPVQEIVDYLSPDKAPECDRGKALEEVLERSREP